VGMKLSKVDDYGVMGDYRFHCHVARCVWGFGSAIVQKAVAERSRSRSRLSSSRFRKLSNQIAAQVSLSVRL